MAIPMVQWGTIFDAISATATKKISEAIDHPTLARSIILEINGGDTPNWALDIQGAYTADGTYHNISYAAADTTPSALSVAQLTVNWTTAQYYVIPNPPPFVRLVATRTGGTLTVKGSFSSEAYSGIGVVSSTVSGTVTANQGTKTATSTNGWLVTPTTAAGVEWVTANVGDAQSPSGMQNVIVMQETGAGSVGPLTAASLAGSFSQTTAILGFMSNGASPSAIQGVATGAATGVGTVSTHDVPTSVSTVTTSQAVSTALDDNLQVKASAGNLYGFTAFSKTAQYIQIHNVSSAPGGGAVPFAGQSYSVAANGTLSVTFDPPLRCGTGIFIGNSTTGDTYTDGGDDVLFGVQYV